MTPPRAVAHNELAPLLLGGSPGSHGLVARGHPVVGTATSSPQHINKRGLRCLHLRLFDGLGDIKHRGSGVSVTLWGDSSPAKAIAVPRGPCRKHRGAARGGEGGGEINQLIDKNKSEGG